MNKQVYVAPFNCVEHLYDDEKGITDRDAFKKITLKCGEILTLIDYEREINLGSVDNNATLILID